MKIGDRQIGVGHPVFICAEISANHLGSYERAEALVRAAHAAGADAVKTQCYAPGNMTLKGGHPSLVIREGPWAGWALWGLYAKAATPLEWHEPLQRLTESLGMVYFASVFDPETTDFMDALGVPILKVASFELTDLPLIRHVASKGKPVILSTGMGSWVEINEALKQAWKGGCGEAILLWCVSGYPTPATDARLRGILDLKWRWASGVRKVLVGFSDHSLEPALPVAAVVLGARVIEKHLTLSRSDGGPDAIFSLEPGEFGELVRSVRAAEFALKGDPDLDTGSERPSRPFRRSLWVTRDVKRGEAFTLENVRSLRPDVGLPPKALPEVLGKVAARDANRGEPLTGEMLGGG